MHQNPDPESPLTENPSIPDPESPLTENTSTPRAPTPSADPGDVSREGLFPIAEEPEEPEDRPEQTLAKSLELLARKIGSISDRKPTSSIKPRNPDTFDGSDPTKVEAFNFQCQMYFSARSADFPTDRACVTFALSYLKGNPLDWFQNELSRTLDGESDPPRWFSNYSFFVKELRRLFGPRDPVLDATNALEALRYKDSTKATRYTIDFNRHGHRTGWNDQALTRQFYKGLPDRLKDEIARVGKPTTLQSLQDLVATLDQRYWERQTEISRDKRSGSSNSSTNQSKSTDNRSDSRSDNRSNPSNSSHNTHKSGQNQQSRNGSNTNQKKPASSSSSSAPNKPSIADLLGPDGKLKPEERKRRMDNSLCLRCGAAGHTVQNCPSVSGASKPKPKGRASSTAPANAATSSSVPPTSGKA
jgi:Retrotransposon gag protein